MARLDKEIRHIAARDPAARTWLEVLLTYPGFHAVLLHRLAHLFWRVRLKLVARIISTFARFLTGVEIHPAAVIGDYCVIDHGMGIVIGETAVIGNRVSMFHGVTLGGLGNHHGKRHPTLEDDVMVGAGAKLLGPITIGKGARVGANAVVIRDVAADTTVVGVPARPVDVLSDAARAAGVETTEEISKLRQELAELEARIMQLETTGQGADLASGGWVPSRRSKQFDA